MKYRVTKNAKVSGAGFSGELSKASQSDLKKLFSLGVKGIEKVEEEAKEEQPEPKAKAKKKVKNENNSKED